MACPDWGTRLCRAKTRTRVKNRIKADQESGLNLAHLVLHSDPEVCMNRGIGRFCWG